MNLEIRTNFQAGYSSKNMGRLASWFDSDWATQNSKFQDRNNWYYDSNADILWGINGNTATIQYGLNRSDFASARGFHEKITVANEVVNADGSIDADITLYISSISGYKTSMSKAGYPAETTITLAGQQVARRTGNTIDTFYMEPVPHEITKHVHLAPSTQSNELDLVYFTHYPQGQYPDSPIKLGLTVYNPIPPQYRPMAIRQMEYNNAGGALRWLSLNQHNGFIKRRQGGSWNDYSLENSNTERAENQGHNRIRKNNKWLQLPRM